jgi:DNA-binding transcriptional ArsR family regulator
MRSAGSSAVLWLAMSISIELPAGTGVRFVVSPVVELGWAWHVLVGAEHHPERAGWVDSVRGVLPADLAGELDAWSFAVSAVRATVLADPTLVPAGPLPDQLAWLEEMPAADFAAALLRPLLRERGRPGAAVRTRTLGLARARGTATVDVVRLLLDEPAAARARLTGLLGRMWTVCFRAEWRSAAPALRRAVDTGTRRLAGDGWPAALRGLSPAMRVEPGRLVIDKVQSKRVSAGGRGLVLTPTRLGGPHLYVADEPGRPVVVHFPIPAPAGSADGRATLRRLAVLAHPVRLEVCRAIAVEARSAREIARLWRMSDTTVTKHLTALRAAGLVRAERAGHFVRYALRAEAIEALGADLVEVLRR